MKEKDNTLVFIDEIQGHRPPAYLLKFLREDNSYLYCQRLVLGGLKTTSSVPLGRIIIRHMYRWTLEEFLIANEK